MKESAVACPAAELEEGLGSALRKSEVCPGAGYLCADGTYAQFLAKLAKTELLILDDLGVASMQNGESRDLLEIIEDRYGVGSTIITSVLQVMLNVIDFGMNVQDAIDFPRD